MTKVKKMFMIIEKTLQERTMITKIEDNEGTVQDLWTAMREVKGLTCL